MVQHYDNEWPESLWYWSARGCGSISLRTVHQQGTHGGWISGMTHLAGALVVIVLYHQSPRPLEAQIPSSPRLFAPWHMSMQSRCERPSCSLFIEFEGSDEVARTVVCDFKVDETTLFCICIFSRDDLYESNARLDAPAPSPAPATRVTALLAHSSSSPTHS
jgi:hypothetical protein